MKTTSVDPQQVMVTTAIDFHTALQAIQEYAAKYPIERVSRDQAKEIVRAGLLLHNRLDAFRAAANSQSMPKEVNFVHRGEIHCLTVK